MPFSPFTNLLNAHRPGVLNIFGTLALTALLAAIFVAPDYLYRFISADSQFQVSRANFLTVMVLTFGVAIAGSAWLRLVVLVWFTIMLVVWYGSYAYFGDVLAPSKILLATDQLFEVGNSIAGGELIYIWPAIVLALATGIVAWVVQHFWPSALRFTAGWLGNLALLAVMGFFFIRTLVHPTLPVVYPSPTNASILGTSDALGVALRLKLFRSTLPEELRDSPTVFTKASAAPLEEPITVAVIMGESINPYQMTNYNPSLDTTPQLVQRETPHDGFQLFKKLGFAQGVSTLSSVPAFLRLDYVPNTGEKPSENLASAAKAAGFQVALLSVQRLKAMQVTGATASADFLFYEEKATPEQAAIHDDLLVELLQGKPISSNRQFYFIHQRVNHSPYLNRCAHLTGGRDDLKDDDIPKTGSERLAAYQTGMRCYDRSMNDLLGYFSKQKGAVYVFATADHNELMGEDNQWGHAIDSLQASLVPVLFYTNRPDNEVAQAFKALHHPSAFQFGQVIAQALGMEATSAKYDPDKFYISNAAAYLASGYMSVKRHGDDRYTVETFSNRGEFINTTDVTLPLR